MGNGNIVHGAAERYCGNVKMRLSSLEENMSTQLLSELLLQNEIDKYEKLDEMSEQEKLLYTICKKELAVIARLKINGIDLRGEVREVKENLERQSLYFIEPEKFQIMKEKARRYDEMFNIVTCELLISTYMNGE